MSLTTKQCQMLKKVHFQSGMIVRISLKDFMTYDDIEIRAYPKLNMILGPNGAGKSTFLCAVVLGFGGKPSVIGRSPNISDYIKRGRDSAEIEIELFNEKGTNHVIGRKINKNNTTKWLLQKRSVTHHDVEEVLSMLHININNLCQMLPQDRVHDFAKMNQKDLLEATQKAVGSAELYETFSKVLSLRNNLINSGASLDEIKKKHDAKNAALKRIEDDVRIYKEKQSLLKKIDMMKKKEAWLLFEDADNKQKESKELYEKLAKKMQAEEKKLIPFKKDIEKAEKKEAAVQIELQKLSQESQVNQDRLTELKKKAFKLRCQLEKINTDLTNKLAALESRESEKDGILSRVQDLTLTLQNVSETDIIASINNTEGEIRQHNHEMTELRSRERQLESQINVLNQSLRAHEQRYRQAESITSRKLAMLNRDEDVVTAYHWIQEHKNDSSLFVGNVSGPMFLEINVASPEKAKYLEHRINRNDLVAFVCDSSEDVRKLVTKLRTEQKLKINVIYAPPAEHSVKQRFQPKVPKNSNFSQYGFTDYLLDLIEGPEHILQYLCVNYNLHNIPIGTAIVDKMVDSIPSHFKLFFSEKNAVAQIASRFSTNTVKTVREVRNATLLSLSTNTELIDQLGAQLRAAKEEMTGAQERASELKALARRAEVEWNTARNKRVELNRQLEVTRTTKRRIKMLRDEVAKLERDTTTAESIKDASHLEIMNCLSQELVVKQTSQETVMSLITSVAALSFKNLEAKMEASRIKKCKKIALQNEIAYRQAKTEAKEKEDVYARLLAESKVLIRKAKEMTEGLTPDEVDFRKRFGKAFKELPNSVNDLREELTQSTAMSNLCSSSSREVVKEYEELSREVAHLDKELKEFETRKSANQQRLVDSRDAWLSKFRSFLDEINSTFEKSFSYLGCNGTLDLDTGSDPDAVENYGLNIKVKFRNEAKLECLNGYTQSGGERSLTTAIFLLSMQKVINVPFRFVDEINQGMDAYNETRVYYLLMCAVKNSNSAQYFLISPKLIPDTKMSLDTAVHIVFSGEANSAPENDSETDDVRMNNSAVLREWRKQDFLEAKGLKY